jgi:hypothetical protein
VAKLMYDVAHRLMPRREARADVRARELVADPMGAAVVVLFAATIFSGIFLNAWEIVRARDDSPQRFATMLQQEVPPNATIETLQWEITFLSDRTYHRPPSEIVNAGTNIVFDGAPAESLQSYHIPDNVSYLVTGSFSNWVGLYKTEIYRGDFRLMQSVGDYKLYQRVQ